MKTIDELKEIAFKFFADKGFDSKEYNAGTGTEFFCNSDYAMVNYRSFDVPEGLSFQIQEVYRSNGTDQNRSIQVEVMVWDGRSSGRRLYIGKIYGKFGDKKISNILNETYDAYLTARRTNK